MDDFKDFLNSDALSGIVLILFIGIPVALGIYQQVRLAKKSKLAFEQAAAALGLSYNSKPNRYKFRTMNGFAYPRTIAGELFGTFKRKQVKIYHFNERQGKKNIPSTYFEVKLNNLAPEFMLMKKGFAQNVLIKLFNPKFIDFNEDYYLASKSLSGEEDINRILADVKKLLSDSVIAQFEALPGINKLSVSDSKLMIIHKGIATSFEELQQFLGFLSSIEKESSF